MEPLGAAPVRGLGGAATASVVRGLGEPLLREPGVSGDGWLGTTVACAVIEVMLAGAWEPTSGSESGVKLSALVRGAVFCEGTVSAVAGLTVTGALNFERTGVSDVAFGTSLIAALDDALVRVIACADKVLWADGVFCACRSVAWGA